MSDIEAPKPLWPSDQKPILRSEMKRRRAALAQADSLVGDRLAETVGAALEALSAWPRPGCVIAGYYPIQSEINPFPLLQLFEDRGHRLCLPCLVAVQGGYVMRFRAFRLGDDLEKGPFDIHQPRSAAGEVTPGMVLVPLLGFTADGHRLGYGGGYYDRALAALRARGDVRVCGIAFSGQELAHLPFEVHDQKLDDIFTEQGVIEARAQAQAQAPP